MRYALDQSVPIRSYLSFDVVVVGSGLAGLYTALHIDEAYTCCVLTKEGVDLSSSWLAQGGIAAAISGDDTPLLHLEDTLIAGAGLCDAVAVKVLVDEGPAEIKNLVSMNVPFDLNEFGDLEITREGGHRKRRIVHAGGDATGRETVKALAYLTASGSSVTFMGRTFFLDVLTDQDDCVCGALIYDEDEGCFNIIRTRYVVIATGGIGQVYKTSTNPEVSTGDGLAAAARAGAKLKHMEFIQFHPTGLWDPGQTGRAFLISEAVRGEGGILRNRKGEAFMAHLHPLRDLAPRDIVARAIIREMEKTGTDHVFLDITEKSDQYLSMRFPTIYRECMERGIILSKDYIPVCPVQHYLIGGIETNLYAETCVPGLYVCGEAASTGVHGANRLASNSMLECLVFGRRAAQRISEALRANPNPSHPHPNLPAAFPERAHSRTDCSALRLRIQSLMNEYGGVVRTEAGLRYALDEITSILDKLTSGPSDTRAYIEVLNIATVAQSILEAALAREESVGAHWRES